MTSLLSKLGVGVIVGFMGVQLVVGAGLFLGMFLESSGRYDFPVIPPLFEGGVILFVGVVVVGMFVGVPVHVVGLGLIWVGGD